MTCQTESVPHSSDISGSINALSRFGSYPEVIRLEKAGFTSAWFRARGPEVQFEEIAMNSSVRSAAFVSREPRASCWPEQRPCVAFDRRRYTLPTLNRGLEEASMCKRLALILLSCVVCVAVAAQQPALTVGTATAVTGQTVTGFIEVSAGSDVGTNIPVAVIRGPKPGATLALVAGAHGTEYASIIALERLIQELNPAEISGTVIIVPLVNIASFEQKVPHVNPVDGKSMNRFYPGNPNGTQTERASWAMTKQVVEKSDYLIDLHGGDLDESLRPYSYWAPTGNAQQDAVSRAMVLAFGLDTIILSTDRPRDPNAARYLETNASLREKPSLTAEAGHAGTVEPEDVTALMNGCLNVMRYLKMLPGNVPPVQNPVWIERIASVTSETSGVFYPTVKRGWYVQQGMKIGYVTDLFGKTVWEARAPSSGVVLYVCAVPSMKKGETVANIGVVADKAP
jgi:predicted deacylase